MDAERFAAIPGQPGQRDRGRAVREPARPEVGRLLLGRAYHDGPLTALIESDESPQESPSTVAARVRAAFVASGAVPPEDVALLPPGALPSGVDGTEAPPEVLTAYRRGELAVIAVDRLTPPAPLWRPSPPPVAAATTPAPTTNGVRPQVAPGTAASPAPGGDHPSPLEHLREDIADLLGLDPDEIGLDDDLIELGMDSIRAMDLVNTWRERGLEVSFADLMERPVLADWARLLAHATDRPAAPAHAETPNAGEPFPLTPVQHAYWIGRRDDQPLGGVGCHFYLELHGEQVDPARLEAAVRALFARHGMLRAVFDDDGRQRVEPDSRWPGLTVHDFSTTNPAAAEAELDRLRADLSHRRLHVERGEVLDVQLSLLPGGATRVHVNTDLLVADVASIRILLTDLSRLYADGGASLPPLDFDFASYLAQQSERRAEAHRRSAQYWRNRLPELPGAPALPLAAEPAQLGRPRIQRHEHRLSAQQWAALTAQAREQRVTLPMALATAFAEVLAAWSSQPRFLLNLPLFDRETIHPAVGAMVADFTNLILLEVDASKPESFAERARRLQQRFRTDVRHSEYSAVEVLRDLARAHPETGTFAPVVFTSAIGMGDLIDAPVKQTFGRPDYMLSQTPQAWLDHQVVELDGGLLLNWDVVSGLFPAGVVEAMFSAYVGLLSRLIDGDWASPVGDILPESQRRVRATVNATEAPVSGRLLHEGFFDRAAEDPDRPALLWDETRSMSYGDLASAALRVAGALVAAGVAPGDAVAVTLPKGPEQVVAVLGVLAAGGVYVPVGVEQPPVRRERILTRAGVRWLLTDEAGAGWSWPQDVSVFTVAEAQAARALPRPVEVADEALAYVIFTSGSTGEPKGVQVSHRAAVNTVEEVNAR
ncbi:AMP-binding protein, partial [Micromonospora fulviviridis]|uniref:AMP-binding protein n=1 Tax=Micromonospora fulviviridis TaxID=47860 RepID=UPI0037B11797